LFLFTLSGALETLAMNRTRRELGSITAMFPRTAIVVAEDGREERRPLEDLVIGDLVVVRAGERLPLDGTIVEGTSFLDESAITGEYLPAEKGRGARVFGGSVNTSAPLRVRCDVPYENSMLSRVIRLVTEAGQRKTQVQQLIERIERPYTIGVLALTVVVLWVLRLTGSTWSDAGYRSITLLIVASPCALIISTPAAVLSGLARAARGGALCKGGGSLEALAAGQVFLFDKTGTITTSRIELTEVIELSERDGDEAVQRTLGLAAALERRGTHPLAHPVLRAAESAQAALPEVTDVQMVAGAGLRGRFDGGEVFVGRVGWVIDEARLGSELGARLLSQSGPLEADGQTAVCVAATAATGPRVSLLAFRDAPRTGAAEAIARLRAAGVRRMVLLTGDNMRVAATMARSVGIEDVRAELLPQDKVRIVEEIESARQRCVMIGDGVNDAAALRRATCGIAMGGVGSDVATEAADIVLVRDDVSALPWLLALARDTRHIVRQNIVFSLTVIGVLIAAALLGRIDLPLGVIGHEGSTLLVVANGVRLLVRRGAESTRSTHE
jgi:Cd2+/Zn2+-exporting ATPase